MPILEARHDYAHPVEGDTAWSESYYFNAYDAGTDSGFFSRIGIRPNEGTMDVGLSLWLPDGDLGEYRSVKEQREMVDTVLEVGAVRYEMLEALQSWRLTMEGEVRSRACVRPAADAAPAGGPAAAHPDRAVPVVLDVRFDAVTPAIGTDGQGGNGPRSAEAAAAAGTVGKGHLEQAGRWSGTLAVDGRTLRVAGCPRQPRPFAGARAAGVGPRCGAGSPSTSGTTRTSVASDSGRAPATSTVAGCGTRAGPRRWPSGGSAPSWPATV